jgi:hypothetical protein
MDIHCTVCRLNSVASITIKSVKKWKTAKAFVDTGKCAVKLS